MWSSTGGAEAGGVSLSGVDDSGRRGGGSCGGRHADEEQGTSIDKGGGMWDEAGGDTGGVRQRGVGVQVRSVPRVVGGSRRQQR